jgi:AraC-like DNA-binding protein
MLEITPFFEGREDIYSFIQVKELIDQRYKKTLLVQDLACAVGMSPSKLQHGFPGVFGFSVSDYILRLRMQEAVRILETTHNPIKSIHSAIAYKSARGFIAAFRKTYNVTPLQYRQVYYAECRRERLKKNELYIAV